MWLLAWTFVQKNWKLVLIGIAVGILIGYIINLKIQVAYYKSQYEDTQLTLTQVVKEAQDYETKLNAANESLTREFMHSLLDRNEELDKVQTELDKRIKADEASKRVILSRNVVVLFNDSTSKPQEPTTTEQGDAAETDGTTTIDQAEGGTRTEGVGYTLNDLLVVSNINNTNHIKCVEQVLEWQSFWDKYSTAVKVLNNSE